MNPDEGAANETLRSDGDLVSACVRGDKASWEEFVRRYCRLIYFFVRRTLARHEVKADPDLLDDLVSETFCSLLEDECRLLRQYSPRYRFSTWLGVIVHSRTLNALRGKNLGVASPPPDDAGKGRLEALLSDPAQEPGQMALDRKRMRLIREAKERLAARDRLILTMFYEDDASLSEIALALGVSYNSVRPLILRAQERLRKALDRE
jgi:RNA polymerase sigma factor (sigma-70 family)